MLRSFLEWLLNGLWTIFLAFYDNAIYPVLVWFWAAFQELSSWVVQQLWLCVLAVWNFCLGLVQTLLTGVWTMIPDGIRPDVASVAGIFGWLDYYMPLTETATVFVLMWGFWSTFITFKYLWRLFPIFH